MDPRAVGEFVECHHADTGADHFASHDAGGVSPDILGAGGSTWWRGWWPRA